MHNDPEFCKVLAQSFKYSPFQPIQDQILPEDACSSGKLCEAFCRVFHSVQAMQAKNVVFVWAMESPFRHRGLNGKLSTIVYIEMSKGNIAGRWPRGFFQNLTMDYSNKGQPGAGAHLQELADRDKNWSFYSQLIRSHGPMSVWWENLNELNIAGLQQRGGVRDWERHLIKSYRILHGRRPLKNRRD